VTEVRRDHAVSSWRKIYSLAAPPLLAITATIATRDCRSERWATRCASSGRAWSARAAGSSVRRRLSELRACRRGERGLANQPRHPYIFDKRLLASAIKSVSGGYSGQVAGIPHKQKHPGRCEMNDQNKILYEHLKDYPTSTDSYHEIGNRAVAAALCCEHMPEIAEASPQKSLGSSTSAPRF
jgi:hypothetical protein